MHMSQQLANLTINGEQIISAIPAYNPSSRFRATTANIVVNILWFTSLALSLISASVAILAKQWLQEYTHMMPETAWKRVDTRQFRFQGLRRWRVNTILKLLPLLLQMSLFLFFVGLSVLLWTVSFPVAAVVTVPVTIWFGFWLTSILLPCVYSDCPYKSAEAAILFAIVQRAKSKLHSLLRSLFMQDSSPRWLKTLVDTFTTMTRQTYGNWLNWEDEILNDRDSGLVETVLGTQELFDSRILHNSIYLSVQDSDIDKTIGFLLYHIQHFGGCYPTEALKTWVPPQWISVDSCIHASVDIFKNTEIPFGGPSLSQTQDVSTPGFQQRQLLVTVLGNYLRTRHRGSYDVVAIVQDLLDLPIYVDLRGLPIDSLAQYTFSMWTAWSKGFTLQLPSM